MEIDDDINSALTYIRESMRNLSHLIKCLEDAGHSEFAKILEKHRGPLYVAEYCLTGAHSE